MERVIEEEVITGYHIPTGKILEQLRFIKRKRKEQMFEDKVVSIEFYKNNPERKLAQLFELRINSDRISLIIEKIKEMQKREKITDFSREFLNTILKTYSKMRDRKRQIVLKKILNQAQVKERVVIKKFLTERQSLGRNWERKSSLVKFYSFL